LEGGGGEENFWGGEGGIADGGGDLAGFFVDVAEAVGFVDDDEVPGNVAELEGFGGGELVGANEDFAGLVKGVDEATLAEGWRFEDFGGEAEFIEEFLLPLLAEGGGKNEKDAAAALGPALGDDEGGLDGFAEADFVSKDDAFGEGGADGEEGGVDLVGVEVDAGGGEAAG
jgi:hypothetical protein